MRCAIGFVALVAVLCFSWSPVMAQDVTTYGSFTVLPSFQSLRTMSRSGDAGGTGIFPGLSQSVLNVGYTNLRADASFNQDGNPFLLGIRHKYVLYGVWYEILQRFFLTENLGVLGIANYLQPTSERLEEDAEFLGGFHARRTWATSTQLWGTGSALTYTVLGSTTFLAGLNWISFDLNFKEITEDNGGQSFVRPQSQVEVRGWTPYLGLAVTHNTSDNLLNVSLIVCPAFAGTLDYRLAGVQPGAAAGASSNFQNSSFVTINAEYTRKILGGGGSIGAFGRYTVIPAEFALGVQPGPGPPPPGDSNVKLRANAQMWIVGAAASFYFAFPI